MESAKQLHSKINAGLWDKTLINLYGEENLTSQKARYSNAFERFEKTYGESRKVRVFSVPGRIKIGELPSATLAAAVQEDMLVIVAENGTNIFRLQSRGFFGEENIDLYQRGPYKEEIGTTSALLRGMLSAFRKQKFEVYGVDIYIDSDILPNIELSSSATIENVLATVFNYMYNGGKLADESLAKLGSWVEKNYYGKEIPVIAEQAAGLVGGITAVTENLQIQPLQDTFTQYGYTILTVALPFDIEKSNIPLQNVTEDVFFSGENSSPSEAIAQILFLNEQYKKQLQEKLLETNPTLSNEIASVADEKKETNLPMEPKALGGASIWRVRQKIFANKIVLFIPAEKKEKYQTKLEALFGENNVTELKLRTFGAVELTGEQKNKEPQQKATYDDIERE